jgi:predicted component of type VI protein secretion system
LIVKAKDVRPTYLDGKSYLGWTSWLISKPATKDDDQIMLYPNFKIDAGDNT